MADIPALEREYTIPLRKYWLRVPQYERTGKAIKAIKQFIAKHMKVPDRDTNFVKLDVYFNNELWFRGRAHPPAKVRVKAKKSGDIVQVTFVETPQHVSFLQKKHEKFHKPAAQGKPAEKPAEPAKAEEQKPETKAEEREKEQAVAEHKVKEAKQEKRAEKHTPKAQTQKAQHPQRMALKK